MEQGLIYFQDGRIIAEHGEATVYKMNNDLFLEIGPGHTLWALESELDDYIEQLYDWPQGNCLEIGLGLGTASRYILSFPEVEHLTTIELNADVIATHDKIPEEERNRVMEYDSKYHTILNMDGLLYAYKTKQKYDFIFIDCYDCIDEETLPYITDLAKACKRILNPFGRIVGWLDKYTNATHYKEFEKIFYE